MTRKHTTAARNGRAQGDITARPPFPYYGAKQRLSKRIVSMLPPHNAWVEAFCGSAALTLAKPQAPIEVINDLDDNIVNLFKQLRTNSKQLCRAVALTPYASEELRIARINDLRLSSLEKARRFLVQTLMTVNGMVDGKGNRSGFSASNSYTREGREARVNRWINLPDRLEQVIERLRQVRIEKRDARDLLTMFSDRPATLVYLDPPYFTQREHQYVIDANDKDFHEQLLNVCRDARCMILLSGYENSLYQRILVREGGWTKKKIQTHTRDTTGRDFARTEVLWMNSRFTKAVQSGRVPIRLSREERKHNKVNPPRNG